MSVTTATAWADNLKSQIDVCKGGLGEVCITGWVYDTDFKKYETAENYGISVRAVVSTAPENIDGINYDETYSIDMEYVERTDVNSTFGLTGKHGFTTKVFVHPDWFDNTSEMTVYVKIYAKVYTNHEEVLLKSTSTTVRMNYGYGTEELPYVLSNAADWNLMADPDLAPFYANSYIRLANVADDGYDYDNSTAATKAFGTSASPFKGHFDGNGQTLNVSLSGTTHVAPFAFTNGATIKNLTVAGSISATQYAGGIVGHGGSSTLSLENCVCDATISGFANYAGGILGWCDDLTLNMNNCLFKGSFSPGSGGKYHPVALKYAPKTVEATVENVYYVQTNAPSAGLGNNAIDGAEGIPVNTTYVRGEWTNGFTAFDGNTYYLECLPPVGVIDYCVGVVKHIYVTGWAYDPNFPSSPITVEARVYSDEGCSNVVKSTTFTTNILRSDVNAARRLKGNHGFDVHIPIDEAGNYYVKFFAKDTAEDGDVQIGQTMAITVAPDTPRLYTDYSAINYLNGMQTTLFVWTYVNLVDNDKGTEWTTGLTRLNCTSTYVDFRSTKAFVPTGYVLSFTGEAVSNSLHKPKSWYVKASRNMDDEWTTIATVTNNDLGYGGEHEFTIDNVTVPYRYFRFEVTDANDRDADLNIAELQLKGYPDGANMGHSPKAGLDRCLALSDRIMVEGWAFDPDVPSECVDVLAYVYTDAACTQELKHVSMWANFASPDANTAHGITGKHGFHTYIPISDAGTYYVKFVAIDITGDEDRQIGSTQAMTITQETIPVVNELLLADRGNIYGDHEKELKSNGWISADYLVKVSDYLFYKTEACNGLNNNYITDLYLSDAPSPEPDKITHNGRTYKLVPVDYQPSVGLYQTNGDIRRISNMPPLHLYYTRQPFDDNRVITSIAQNFNSSGALGLNGSTEPYNINEGYVDYARYIHFTTATAIQPFAIKMPYSYSFERPMDEDGWTVKVTDGWVQIKDGYFQFSVKNSSTQYLFSPLIDTDAPMKVEFDIYSYGNNDTFLFGYSKTTNEASDFKWESGQQNRIFSWQHFEYEAPIGTKYIAISTNTSFYIDNFNFTTKYNIAPKDFVVIEQNPLSATLAWSAPETSAPVLCYKYQYKVSGDADWSGEFELTAGEGLPSPTFTLGGLAYDTPYDFRVRVIYEDGTYSKYLSGSFHTTPLPQPDQLYLSNLTDQAFTVCWSAPASEFIPTSYIYQFLKTGDSDWSAATMVGAATTSASFSGLTANTGCQFRIKAHYAEGDSPYTTFSFSTPDVWELPYDCGFENGLNGLAILNPYIPSKTSDYFTGINTSKDRPCSQLDGEHAFMFLACSYNMTPQYLMSQLLPEGVVKKLTFYYRTRGMGYRERFQVGYSTTSNDPSTFTWDDEVETYIFEYYTKYVMLAPANARYVAIRYLSNDKYSIYIDNLSIEEYSDKAAPANLVATDLVDQFATKIDWSAPNASVKDYAYQYKKAIEDTWSNLTTTTATTVTLSGLTVNTDYQFRVKARYADGSSSNFETVFFKSDGGIESLPYEWGFEEGMGGFRVMDNVRDTRYVNFTWHQGHNAFRFSPTNGNLAPNTKMPQYLISPQFDCQSPMKVSFFYKITDDEDDILTAAFQVGYSTTSNAIGDFQWLERENVSTLGWQQYVCYCPEGTKFVAIKWLPNSYFIMLDDFRFEGSTYLHLADNADNTEAISQKNGRTSCDVHLDGRTLYRDGDWNTLCLPFTLDSFSGTPLDGFVAKELDTEKLYDGHVTSLDDNGTLYLNFKEATSIMAGHPYIVRYEGLAGADASLLTYHAERGSKGSSSSDDYFNLVDGDPNTKWYTHYYEQTNDRWFCDFSTSNLVNVTGYTLNPGGDMQNNPDRAPRIWTLKARGSESDEWTLIDERNVSDNSGDAMSTTDYTPTSYAIASDKQGNYQYFRLEVYSTGGEYIQLAELTLQGTIAAGNVPDITNPVFNGVTINAAAPTPVTFTGGQFVGTYSPVALTVDDQSNLFLGANNTLYWPSAANNDDGKYYINACRAYFHIGNGATVREFRLNFGDEDTQGIVSTTNNTNFTNSDAWYSLDGRKVDGVGAGPVPARLRKGIYINNGKKVVK
ncbi:MAG: fibronectin type III domain-containing protein [Prevotella sp.]|nr:fibronectin type III domain-containing protein [Prevotella sp.]